MTHADFETATGVVDGAVGIADNPKPNKRRRTRHVASLWSVVTHDGTTCAFNSMGKAIAYARAHGIGVIDLCRLHARKGTFQTVETVAL